jgi:hypothetical protein
MDSNTRDKLAQALRHYETAAPVFLNIYDKDSRLVRLKLTDIQRRFLRERGQKTIVLKARQVRISTVVLGEVYHQCITNKGVRAVTVAQDKDSTKRLFNRVRVMQREMRPQPAWDRDNASELALTDLDSTYYIGTAGARRFGRSDTLHYAHLTEFAFWPNWDVFTGLPQSLAETGRMVIESTPNGFNYFYQLWRDAKTGVFPYTPLFFPWYLDGTYRKAGASIPQDEWTDEEKIVAEKALGYGVVLDGAQVAWRRDKWAELTDESGISRYPQEYPDDDQTCFMASGRPRFDVGRLNAILPAAQARRPMVVQPIVGTQMTLREWEAPEKGAHYVIGADCAEGVSAGDNNNACVIEWKSGRKVADMWGKAELFQYGDELVKLAKRWNNARLTIEINNMGIAVQKRVEEGRYPNLYFATDEKGYPVERGGWRTDAQSRPVLVDALAQFYRQASAEDVPDADEIGEAMAFVIGAHGKAQASAGAHDDKVMARGVALMARAAWRPVTGEVRSRGGYGR